MLIPTSSLEPGCVAAHLCAQDQPERRRSVRGPHLAQALVNQGPPVPSLAHPSGPSSPPGPRSTTPSISSWISEGTTRHPAPPAPTTQSGPSRARVGAAAFRLLRRCRRRRLALHVVGAQPAAPQLQVGDAAQTMEAEVRTQHEKQSTVLGLHTTPITATSRPSVATSTRTGWPAHGSVRYCRGVRQSCHPSVVEDLAEPLALGLLGRKQAVDRASTQRWRGVNEYPWSGYSSPIDRFARAPVGGHRVHLADSFGY